MMEWQKKHAFIYKYKTVQGWLMFALTCVCAAIFVSSWLFWMVGHQRIAGILLGTGVPEKSVFASQRDVMPPGELSDIAVNDEGVFLLFETSAVVRAYDHDGVYRYSLLFSNPSGRSGRLYAKENDLFYRQVQGYDYLYHLQSGVFRARYDERDESYNSLMAQLQGTEPEKEKGVCWYGDVQYSIDGQDVMRIHPDGGIEKLIDGPEFLGMLEHSQVWLCDVVFMLLTPVCWMTSLRVDRKYAKPKK